LVVRELLPGARIAADGLRSVAVGELRGRIVRVSIAVAVAVAVAVSNSISVPVAVLVRLRLRLRLALVIRIPRLRLWLSVVVWIRCVSESVWSRVRRIGVPRLLLLLLLRLRRLLLGRRVIRIRRGLGWVHGGGWEGVSRGDGRRGLLTLAGVLSCVWIVGWGAERLARGQGSR
jgi:hypothetical protein